jgi:DNA-binding SARP family transcriptional activator
VCIHLFGRFEAELDDPPATVLTGRRARELLSYLVLHRQHPQQREALAALLWEDAPLQQARKYLRQALWQIQSNLDLHSRGSRARQVLEVDAEWIQWSVCDTLQIDVVRFEEALHHCQGLAGPRLDDRARDRLEEAVALYRGDLLEGWYLAWCLPERERLQIELLDALEKLIAHYETCRDSERGLLHARRVLGIDPAHEQAHRHVMRLLALAGNRTQALRQYQCCERILMQELGVAPSGVTRRLYDALREDRWEADADTDTAAAALPGTAQEPLPALLHSLQHLQAAFSRIEAQLHSALGAPPPWSGGKPG